MPQNDHSKKVPGPADDGNPTDDLNASFPDLGPEEDSPAPRLDEEFVLDLEESDEWLLMDDVGADEGEDLVWDDRDQPQVSDADQEVAAPDEPAWLSPSGTDAGADPIPAYDGGDFSALDDSMSGVEGVSDPAFAGAYDSESTDYAADGVESDNGAMAEDPDAASVGLPKPAWLTADSAAELSGVADGDELSFHDDHNSVSIFDEEESADHEATTLQELDLHPDLIEELEADFAAASVATASGPMKRIGLMGAAAVILAALGYFGLKMMQPAETTTTDNVAQVPAPVAQPTQPEPTPTPVETATLTETAAEAVATTPEVVTSGSTTANDPNALVDAGSSAGVVVETTRPGNSESNPLTQSWPGAPDQSDSTGTPQIPLVVDSNFAAVRPATSVRTQPSLSNSALSPGKLAVIRLPNGHVFRGQVKRIRKGNVTLSKDRAEFTFAIKDVEILDPSSSEYVERSDLPAASITLVNGQRLRGSLVEDSEEAVVLRMDNGRIRVPRSEVQSVSFAGRVHF